ncbi:MAG TPA: cupin domain-containing protein [Gemmatimonadaceae bacterium]|nr:cupin domain-containing protein [Gemmatimonadaceae bacterium]
MTMPADSAVFHLCTQQAVANARHVGTYRAPSLDTEGFIHLSRATQVLPTAAAYFAGVPDVVVLVIDPTLLSVPLIYEAAAPLPTALPKPPDEALYPHCYGEIDLAAIVDVIGVAQFTGTAIHADTMSMLRRYRFERLPVEGTLYHSTWRSEALMSSGEPVGTAMIGLYTDSPSSVSRYHRLAHDEVWHAYGGDPFTLYLLHADGRSEQVVLGHDAAAGQHVQYVVPAGTWQAGAIVSGGRYALFGCTMAPGFTSESFEAARAAELLARFPAAAASIERLGVFDGVTRMPDDFPG